MTSPLVNKWKINGVMWPISK